VHWIESSNSKILYYILCHFYIIIPSKVCTSSHYKPLGLSGIPANASYARLVIYVFASVPLVHAIGIAQILPPVISGVTILVIDSLWEITTHHVQPCKSMGDMGFLQNAYLYISVAFWMSFDSACNFSCVISIPLRREILLIKPNKNPGKRIIAKPGLQIFLRNFHSIALCIRLGYCSRGRRNPLRLAGLAALIFYYKYFRPGANSDV